MWYVNILEEVLWFSELQRIVVHAKLITVADQVIQFHPVFSVLHLLMDLMFTFNLLDKLRLSVCFHLLLLLSFI